MPLTDTCPSGGGGFSATPSDPKKKVFMKSFCKSQFPHKSVNLFIVLVIIKDKLMDLWEG